MDLYGNTTGTPTVAVLFLHGFQGNRTHLRHHAEAIASACPEKAVCACVDLPSLTKGGTFREIFVEQSVRSAQVNAVTFVVETCRTLRDRFAKGGGEGEGGGGLKSIILVGHSAGGAITIEAAVALQDEKRKEKEEQKSESSAAGDDGVGGADDERKEEEEEDEEDKSKESSATGNGGGNGNGGGGGGGALDVAGLVLLDAVPWEGTVPVAARLDVGSGSMIRILSVRCDPSSWNRHGIVRPMTETWAEAAARGSTTTTTTNNDVPSSDEAQHKKGDDQWSFGRVLSVHVRGSRHFDPVESGSLVLRLLGQRGSKAAREGMARLVRAYISDLVRSDGTLCEETDSVLASSTSLFDIDGK